MVDWTGGLGDADGFDLPRTRGEQIFASLGRGGPGPSGPPPGIAHEIPDYRIVPEPKLGEGKFSDVYRARDLVVPRDVAIKILREGTEPNAVQRERMKSEARALGKLQGTAAGRHIVEIYNRSPATEPKFYLVLELIEGKSLADRIQEVGPLPARPAARLVRTIAEVMDAVHQLGIVHRDLKPSNVLLATGDLPKITDFGLARFADNQDGLTIDGEILGTPEYMPPEQAGSRLAEVDAVSDVYSIGVILYECLTGKPPFRGVQSFETIASILDENREIVPPEKLVPSVPHDLSTICLKCLNRKKEARYPTAGALAGDLRRFLDGHPIQARRAGTVERAAKLVRRNPGISALTSLVVLSVVLGVGATLVYAGRAIRQERRANTNAELRFHALENVLTAVSDDRLRRAGQRPLQVELMGDLLPQFEAVIALEGDDPATRNLQGLAWANLAKIRRDLGKYSEALAAARSGEAIFRNLGNVAAWADQANIGLATALGYEAAILGQEGKFAEAIAASAEAARRLEPIASEATPTLLERLAHIHNNWANCLMRLSQGAPESIPLADQHYRVAVDDFRRGARTLRTCRDWQARSLSNLALFVAGTMNRPRDGLEPARQAVAVAQALADEFPDEIDSRECLASCLTNLGEIQLVDGDLAASLPLFQKSLTLYEQLSIQVPSNFDFRWSVAMARSTLGQCLTAGPTADRPKAIDLLRQAESSYRELTKEVPGNLELAGYVKLNRERIEAFEAKGPPAP